jgi:hypothetical protein
MIDPSSCLQRTPPAHHLLSQKPPEIVGNRHRRQVLQVRCAPLGHHRDCLLEPMPLIRRESALNFPFDWMGSMSHRGCRRPSPRWLTTAAHGAHHHQVERELCVLVTPTTVVTLYPSGAWVPRWLTAVAHGPHRARERTHARPSPLTTVTHGTPSPPPLTTVAHGTPSPLTTVAHGTPPTPPPPPVAHGTHPVTPLTG